MIVDHFCAFPDEATAKAALPAYHYANGNWDTSRVLPAMRIITADAVWDRSDPLNPVLVTPETILPGWWIAISDKTAIVSAIMDIPGNACRVVLDRDKAQTEPDRSKLILYISAAADPSVLSSARISPVFSGAPYSSSQAQQQQAGTAPVPIEDRLLVIPYGLLWESEEIQAAQDAMRSDGRAGQYMCTRLANGDVTAVWIPNVSTDA